MADKPKSRVTIAEFNYRGFGVRLQYGSDTDLYYVSEFRPGKRKLFGYEYPDARDAVRDFEDQVRLKLVSMQPGLLELSRNLKKTLEAAEKKKAGKE